MLPFLPAARGGLLTPGAMGAAVDPFWSFVVFLTGFEGPDGSTTALTSEDTIGHTINLSNLNLRIDTENILWGTSSLRGFNTEPGFVPAHTAFELSNANSDKFVIEFTLDISSLGNTINTMGPFGFVAGIFSGWLVRAGDGTNFVFLWGNAAGGLDTLSAAGGMSTGKHMYAISKDSGGKLRLFKDGVMLTSSTPADSTIKHNGFNMGFAPAGASQVCYLDEWRITKGSDRGYGDAGYTVQTGPFPRM